MWEWGYRGAGGDGGVSTVIIMDHAAYGCCSGSCTRGQPGQCRVLMMMMRLLDIRGQQPSKPNVSARHNWWQAAKGGEAARVFAVYV